MTSVSHGKPCAGNPHARFEEGASAPESPRRNALLHKRNMIAKCILCAATAFVALCGRADLPRPSYTYHAMWYPTWLIDKLTDGHGHAVMLAISIVVMFTIWVLVHNSLRRQKRLKAVAALVRWTIMIVVVSGGLCVIWFGKQQVVTIGGGHLVVLVKPSPNESYSQYRERTRRLENDLCLTCGTKLEHWYYRGRHSGCPKCDKLYGTCKECGKEFKRFNRGWHVYSTQEGTKDPKELCDACIELHGILVR